MFVFPVFFGTHRIVLSSKVVLVIDRNPVDSFVFLVSPNHFHFISEREREREREREWSYTLTQYILALYDTCISYKVGNLPVN